jgi:hypothetical protein
MMLGRVKRVWLGRSPCEDAEKGTTGDFERERGEASREEEKCQVELTRTSFRSRRG